MFGGHVEFNGCKSNAEKETLNFSEILLFLHLLQDTRLLFPNFGPSKGIQRCTCDMRNTNER